MKVMRESVMGSVIQFQKDEMNESTSRLVNGGEAMKMMQDPEKIQELIDRGI